MVSSADREADTPTPAPPLAEKLARRLLRSEIGDRPSAEELAAAMTGIYQGCAHVWWSFLANKDSMRCGAIHLARQEFQAWDDAAGEGSSLALPPGLHGIMHGGDPAEAHARLIAAFASFITLLFTFIGEDLGVRLIYQASPDLPADAADPHDLPHVFEKHYRARTRGKVEGSGLGLYISRLLVEAHGGQLWAESSVGKGSRFTFTLPMTK